MILDMLEDDEIKEMVEVQIRKVFQFKKASYKKSIEFKNGTVHHYPIRQFSLRD